MRVLIFLRDLLLLGLTIIGALWVLATMFPAAAAEKCVQLEPGSMIWTGTGYSVTIGEGQTFVARDDVHYSTVAIPTACIPDKGLMRLYLPSAWPSYAASETPWLPPRCCDLYSDCVRLPDGAVKQTPYGFEFVWKRERYKVKYQDALESEDGHYYACFPGGSLGCFAAPKGGF